MFVEKHQHRGFLRLEVVQVGRQLLLCPLPDRGDGVTVEIGADHRWVDVALPADRRGVPQPAGDPLDRRDDVLLRRRVGVELLELRQRLGGELRPGPGAEILGGEVLAADLPEVGVDVARGDILTVAILVEILEQLLPRHFLAALDDACQSPVVQVDLVLDAGLAVVAEGHRRAVDLGVAVAHRCQAVGPVLLRVLVVADADQRCLQQPDDQRQDLLPRQPVAPQVGLDALADARQRLAEGNHVLILVGIANLAPLRVIAVLLASLRIASGRLDVAIG